MIIPVEGKGAANAVMHTRKSALAVVKMSKNKMTLAAVQRITVLYGFVFYVFPEPQLREMVRLLPPYQWQTTNCGGTNKSKF